MAEPSVTEVFQALNNELTNDSTALTEQGISTRFKGKLKCFKTEVNFKEKDNCKMDNSNIKMQFGRVDFGRVFIMHVKFRFEFLLFI